MLNRPTLLKLLLILYIPVGMILLSVFVVSVQYDIPVSNFTRDPADLTRSSPFLGIISNLSVLFWCSTAAICFFSFYVNKHKNFSYMAFFFLMSGLITSLLLCDDLFLLHERIFPQYFNWRQRYIYLSYASIVFIYLLMFREIIFKTNFIVLALAFCFFFLSIGVDCMVAKMGDFLPFYHLYEDGFKLLGIVSWLGYFAETSFHAVVQPAGR